MRGRSSVVIFGYSYNKCDVTVVFKGYNCLCVVLGYGMLVSFYGDCLAAISD